MLLPDSSFSYMVIYLFILAVAPPLQHLVVQLQAPITQTIMTTIESVSGRSSPVLGRVSNSESTFLMWSTTSNVRRNCCICMRLPWLEDSERPCYLVVKLSPVQSLCLGGAPPTLFEIWGLGNPVETKLFDSATRPRLKIKQRKDRI